jgi:hypothetical protein
MSGNDGGSRTPTRNDTDWFTDAAQLTPPADVVKPAVLDPDTLPPTVDSIDGHAEAHDTGAAPLTGKDEWNADQVRKALAGDEAGLNAFQRLAQSGRLAADPELLPNLAALATNPRDPRFPLEGIDPQLILSQVVRAIDNPLRVKQGCGRGTCGAGTLQYMLTRKRPAELVRLVDGLTRHGSEVAMRSGAKLTLPPTAVERDDSGRVDVDRLFQSALMNRGTLMSWLFDYDNQKDEDTFAAAIQGSSQMPTSGVKNVWADLTGESLTAKTAYLGGGEELAKEVTAALTKGGMVPVLLTWSSSTSFHFLVAEKVERGSSGEITAVYLRNPMGQDAGAGGPPRTPRPEGGGRISMKLSDFAAHLVGAVLND